MAEIQLKHIYKQYENGTTAVKNFHLDIEKRDFVVFVGPSGCGKSTTLRMIAGLESISQGELMLDGRKINEVPSCDRDMAMVFQNYALYPHMTVAENMGYSLKLKKIPKAKRREKVEEIARILGLENILNRHPDQLSGGQKQRVAMGRAIIREPKVFLMDEPLSNLDTKLRTQMRGEIMKLYRQLNTTFIYVTHDQTEAMTLGTKIVVLKDGEIQQIATPRDLYEKPANVFVAGFIGMPTMNFFTGRCVWDSSRRTCLQIAGAEFPAADELKELIESKKLIGKQVTVGVRPEHMRLAGNEPGIRDTVRVCERLGAENHLYFECEGSNICVRVRADNPLREGSKAKYTFDITQVHLFDICHGERIYL